MSIQHSLVAALRVWYHHERINTACNFNYDTMRYPYKFTQNLNVSGSVRLSEGWNINFSSGYDFENKKSP